MQSLCTQLVWSILCTAAAHQDGPNPSTSPTHPTPPTIPPVAHTPSAHNAGKFLSAQNTAELSQLELDWIERREVIKDVFDFSIGGMIDAIDEVQNRGDTMMTGIKKQKEVLEVLKAEIRKTKDKLAAIDKEIKAQDERMGYATEDTENAELDVNRINKLRVSIKEALKKMEKAKAESEDTLRLMETQIEELVVEMEERKPKLIRMGQDMVPMRRNVEETEAELVSLRQHLSERSAKSHQVESKLAASSTQLSHLQDRITSLSNLPLTSSDKGEEEESIFSSSPPILPALVVSTALNMMTGATLFSKFLVATTTNLARMDTEEKVAKERELAKVVISKEHVDLIMHEMELPKDQTERILREHGGDVVKALAALVNVPA